MPSLIAARLTELLRSNADIHAAWIDHTQNPPHLVLLVRPRCAVTAFTIPPALAHFPRRTTVSTPFRTMLIPADRFPPQNAHQDCQNEPIRLGTQIQPAGANWYGTAGAPVKWIDEDAQRHWGILSNWHVMAAGREVAGRTQHQPTLSFPPMARLSEWESVSPTEVNYADAAIADAMIAHYHTIGMWILGIGTIGPEPQDATVHLAVRKAGRTTRVTTARCTAVGASVRVNYGDFVALFEDQDLFESTQGAFSGPGDSGSLIVAADTNNPVSLLFAGNYVTTVANPIRYVNEALGLVYPFP